MSLEILRQNFGKAPNIKFNDNLSGGSLVVPCGRTDRHDEANSLFPQLCKSAYKV